MDYPFWIIYKTGKTYAKEYSQADYISYLIELISHAKKRFPNKYKGGTSDLDILADIQHNGGATCLVDFSKNILTALWLPVKAMKITMGIYSVII